MKKVSPDELLTILGGALAPIHTVPDDVTLDRLHESLAVLKSDAGVTITRTRRPGPIDAMRRRAAQRVAAVSAVVVLLSGGVATAAVVTNTLPGPTRNIVYDLGLPVTSPGLYQAQQNLDKLRQSVGRQNHREELHWGHELEHSLTGLTDGDLAQIRAPALHLLQEAGLEDSSLGKTTPADNNNSDSRSSPSVPDTSEPSTSDSNSSDSNTPGSNPTSLIPTLPVKKSDEPSNVVTTVPSEGGQEIPTTTSPSLNSEQNTTTTSDVSVSGDAAAGGS